MKANELRKGNKVYYNGNIIEIFNIDDMIVNFTYVHEELWDQINIDFIEPIPLTEEILLKAGLKKEEIWDEGYLDYIIYKFNGATDIDGFCAIKYFNTKYYFAVADELGYGAIGNELKYLHTIQNIYFALSGKELTIE